MQGIHTAAVLPDPSLSILQGKYFHKNCVQLNNLHNDLKKFETYGLLKMRDFEIFSSCCKKK